MRKVKRFKLRDPWKSKKTAKKAINSKIKRDSIARAKRLARRATDSEKALKQALDDRSIRYEFQRPVWGKSTYKIVDFWIPRGRRVSLIVEVDGLYHDDGTQKLKDIDRRRWLREHTGAEILVVTNAEVDTDVGSVIARIKTYL